MKKALDGEQNEASKMLLADVQEANDLGMVHYISNAQLQQDMKNPEIQAIPLHLGIPLL